MPTYDGIIRDKGGAVYNVTNPDFGADPTGATDSTTAIQNAWDAAKAKGGRVFVPEGTYTISLRGSALASYTPALTLAANGTNKELQPLLEGAGRGTTFQIAFPADAPRDLEVIRLDKGALSDNPRGMGLHNFRLVNTNTPADNENGVDYRGVGIKVVNAWTGRILDNFQVTGFYAGVWYNNGYNTVVSNGEIRNCNFGLYLRGSGGGVGNGNRYEGIGLQKIRPVVTVENDIDADTFPPDASQPSGYRVGACVFTGGGTQNAIVLVSVNPELCSTVGFYVAGGTLTNATVIDSRMESVYAPVWIYGPLAPYRTSAVTFINPSIDCDSLIAPAIYLHRAAGYVFVNPLFYQRDVSGHQTAVEMTSGSFGNLVIAPFDGDRGANGNLAAAIVDTGINNRVEWLTAFDTGGAAAYNSDGNLLPLPLMVRNGVTAGAGQPMEIAGAAGRTSLPPWREGSVLGIAVRASATPAADALTFAVTRNGAAWSGGPAVTLPVGQTTARVVFGKGQHDFAATDAIGLTVTPGSSFGGQTVDVDGAVFVEV